MKKSSVLTIVFIFVLVSIGLYTVAAEFKNIPVVKGVYDGFGVWWRFLSAIFSSEKVTIIQQVNLKQYYWWGKWYNIFYYIGELVGIQISIYILRWIKRRIF